MVTANKTDKPKIYTESDHLLNDLKEELAGLKSRMSVIEDEQEKNRVLLNQLSIQEDLTNELLSNQQNETEAHRENYQVIANVMRHLRSPVSSVVDNLAGILIDVDDSETQRTLKQCMDTASEVVHSFNEVANFCMDVSDARVPFQKTVLLKEFIKETVYEFQEHQQTDKLKSLRLQIDGNTPDSCPLYADTVRSSLRNLLNELVNMAKDANIMIRVSVENNEMKYGVQISDLTFHVNFAESIDFHWGDSWVSGIQINQGKLINSGFNLLKTRDALRKCGGHLDVSKDGDNLRGFKVFVPLTY